MHVFRGFLLHEFKHTLGKLLERLFKPCVLMSSTKFEKQRCVLRPAIYSLDERRFNIGNFLAPRDNVSLQRSAIKRPADIFFFSKENECVFPGEHCLKGYATNLYLCSFRIVSLPITNLHTHFVRSVCTYSAQQLRRFSLFAVLPAKAPICLRGTPYSGGLRINLGHRRIL